MLSFDAEASLFWEQGPEADVFRGRWKVARDRPSAHGKSRDRANQQRIRARPAPLRDLSQITNGFRAVWAANHYADVRSVIETARRRGLRALKAIRLTLAEQPLPIPA
jgi:hypothetical protein